MSNCNYCLSTSCKCLKLSVETLKTTRIVNYSLCKTLYNGCNDTTEDNIETYIYKGDYSKLNYLFSLIENTGESFYNLRIKLENSRATKTVITSIKVNLMRKEKVLFSQVLSDKIIVPANGVYMFNYFSYLKDDGGEYKILVEFREEISRRQIIAYIRKGERTSTTQIDKLVLKDPILSLETHIDNCSDVEKEYLYKECCKLVNIASLHNECDNNLIAESNCVTYDPKCVELCLEGSACVRECEYAFCLCSELSCIEGMENTYLVETNLSPSDNCCDKVLTEIFFTASLSMLNYEKIFTFKVKSGELVIDSGSFTLSNAVNSFTYDRILVGAYNDIKVIIEHTIDTFDLKECKVIKGEIKVDQCFNLNCREENTVSSGLVISDIITGILIEPNNTNRRYFRIDGREMTKEELVLLTSTGLSLSKETKYISYLVKPESSRILIITSSRGNNSYNASELKLDID